MDLSSFTIGILIGAVGVFATGFLRKAGEDLYVLIKRRIKPERLESDVPQVVVNLHGNGPVNSQYLLPATVDHTSSVTFSEIVKERGRRD